MIELFNRTGQRAYVSKIIVDGEEVEYSDKWSAITPQRGYSEIECILIDYIQDKENKINELLERVYVIENKIEELERGKLERSKNESTR